MISQDDGHDLEREAKALDAYLHAELPLDHPELPKAEAELAVALKSAAQEIHPSVQFEAELEQALMREARRKPSGLRRSLNSAGRTFAWAGLAIVLLLGLSWVFRTLLPELTPGTRPTDNASPVAVLPGITEPSPPTKATRPVETTPVVTAEASPLTYNLPMLSEVAVVRQAELPESPSEVQLYQQKAWPTLTAEAALQMAKQLGIDGQLYQSPLGPPGRTSLMVSDGFARLTFQQAAPWYLFSAAGNTGPLASSALTPEQILAAGEGFIKTHNLDTFEYQAESQSDSPGTVLFVQTLDGHPLSFPPFDAPKIRVLLDNQGQAIQVESSLVDLEPLGSYPILSAQEAWDKALSPNTQEGLETYEIRGHKAALRMWQREYPLDSKVELFGYAQSYPALDSNTPPLIFFKEYLVSGNTQGLVDAAASNRFVQAWGSFQEDNRGRRSFQMDGWQASFFPDQTLEGTIERQAGQVYLATADQRLRLPEAPADLSDGMAIRAQGVVLEDPDPALEWANLYAGPMGGGGGGGGISFAELNLAGPLSTPATPAQPTATQAPVISVGQRVDGAQGRVTVFINQYDDGSTEVEAMMHLDPGADWPEGLTVLLKSPDPESIKAYHNLPVSAWGEISDTTWGKLPVLRVERLEPVFPDLKVETWLGLLEVTTQGDQQVLLFTAGDGQQFVLDSSIKNPEAEELPGAPSDPVVVEGLLLPGQVLGDYAVITDFVVQPMPGLTDLSEYQPFSGKPIVMQKSGTAGEQRKAVIDKIELVYITDDPRYADPTVTVTSPYIQPAWRFSGQYKDGASLVILVQALKPEYLK